MSGQNGVALTEEASPLARALAHLDATRPADRSLPSVRAYLDAMLAMEPPPEDVAHEATVLGGVPAELLTPAEMTTHAVILYLHGGGYCFGTLAGYRPLAARLAKAFAGQTYVLDYRLAPEHPFPAAIDDTLAAWRALVEKVDAKKIVVVGDSAGAGLALALLQKLRAQGEAEALPAGFAFFSPWVDVVGTGASMDTRAELDPIVSREKMAILAQMYLGADHDRTDPLVSPVHASDADLAALPPTLVHMGSREVELDDVTRFVERARRAGASISMKTFHDVLHVFQMFPVFPEAEASLTEVGAFARAKTRTRTNAGITPAGRG